MNYSYIPGVELGASSSIGKPATARYTWDLFYSWTWHASSAICQYQQDGADHWHIEWDDESKVPYGSDGTLWVGYDSPDSLWIKAQYVSDNGLGGAMVWSIDMDDARGTCGNKYHLLKNINTVLRS
ncbi:unnamed protein product [Timema podura]|uniref:GH18 domain-containing protein n=1 Tax=Timema podura TaxID=61482 RepID=A0ABN7NJT6_TIMPD|nr:unnamed protein product [Timema podura]